MDDIKQLNLRLNENNFEDDFIPNKNHTYINPLKRMNETNNQEPTKINNVSKNGFFNNLDEFDFEQVEDDVNIKIIGLGGAGNNMIAHIAQTKKINHQNLYAINTDYQFLKKLPDAFNKIIIGKNATKGRGSGSNPIVGRESAIEDIETFKNILSGVDLLFIVSGMGKGTGTGASPVVAKLAKEMGILTLCVVNIPSIKTEGNLVYEKGINGLNELRKYADGISIISNEKIIDNQSLNVDELSLKKSFEIANDQIANTVEQIIDTVNTPFDINIDFNDVKNFFSEQVEFQLDTFEFNKDDDFEQKIKNRIATQIYQEEIKNIDKVLINFKVNENVPQYIITNIRQAYENIVNNSKFPLTYSILYNNDIEFANVSVLIATKINQKKISKDEIYEQFNKDLELINNHNNDIVNNNLFEQEEINLLKEDCYNQNVENIYIKTSLNLNNQQNEDISFDNQNHLIEETNDNDDMMDEFKILQNNFEKINNEKNNQDFDQTENLPTQELNVNNHKSSFSSTKLNSFFSKTLNLFQKTKQLK